jgi:hypothetical protein
MQRRVFITLLGAVTAWPFAAHAQQPTMPVIGFLHSGSPKPNINLVTAFRDGLNEAGYVDDKNVAIEFYWAGGRYDRLPELAAHLVLRKVAVIFGAGPPAAHAARSATTTIPIVFVSGDDPVKSASFITILYAMHKLHFEGDPYVISDLGDEGRQAALPSRLHHFTSLGTAAQIIEKDNIRLSHAEYSNDQTEMAQAQELISVALQVAPPSHFLRTLLPNTKIKRLISMLTYFACPWTSQMLVKIS